MDEPVSAGVPQHWREDQAFQLPRRSAAAPALGVKVFFVLALMLALVALIAAIISWLGPRPNPAFLPIYITDYRSSIPYLPMAQRDRESMCQGGYFANMLGDTPSRQAGQQVLQDLSNLKNLAGQEGVVVYLRAYALRDGPGDVHILPADASIDEPRTWIKLREILERLRACTGRKKLLVLDIMSPLPAQRLGALLQDVAGAIPAELEAVPDPERLVLCSCSPGQTALVSEELGRSVFSHYFEEGLKGYAEVTQAGQRRDGLVSVRELAAFVRARVDRWALRNRGSRQTPVLHGSGPDFPLVAAGRRETQPTQVRELTYAAELAEAWKLRDACWQDGACALSPRAFMRAQALLLEAEKNWHGGCGSERIKEAYLVPFERCQAELQRSKEVVRPIAVSLTQQAEHGAAAEERVRKTFEEWLALYPLEVAQARPEDAVPLRARLVDELRDKIKDAPPHALARTVFRLVAEEAKQDPATLRLLDQVVRRSDRQALQTVEMQLLGQLAELAGTMEDAWPAEIVGRVLEVARKGEQASSNPRVFPWIRSWLEEASQSRHEAEVHLWARGFASLEDVDRLSKSALPGYETALKLANKISSAHKAVDEAFAVLPFYALYVESAPGLQKAWELAGQDARSLAEPLRAPPTREEVEESQQRGAYLSQLSERIDGLGKAGTTLRDDLRELEAPFAAEKVQHLVNQSRLAEADGNLYVAMVNLLVVPHPSLTSADRALLWTAAHALGKRLAQETLRLDREDNRRRRATANPEPWDVELALLQETTRASERGRAVLAVLELGGVAASTLKPVREALDRANREPTAENWCKAGAVVREMWSSQLPLQYGQQENPGRRVQLAWILPGLDTFPVIDEANVSAATQVRQQEVCQLWTWLSDHYRYRARDYEGLGLDSPALASTRQFFAGAALANRNLAQRPADAYVTLRLPKAVAPLTPEKPAANFKLEVRRFLPEDVTAAVDLVLERPDNAWLQVSPDSASIAVTEAATGQRTLTSSIPVQVTLRPGAERSAYPRPEGLLAQARLNGRAFHRALPVPLSGLSHDLQLLVSANPKEPEPALQELRLRPGKVRQNFFLYVKNLAVKKRTVVVEVFAQDGLVAAGTLTLAAMEMQPVRLEDRNPANVNLPVIHGPLEVRVRDVEQPRPPLLTYRIPVVVASPREYVAVDEVRLDASGPGNAGETKLVVKLRALAPIAGPAIPADLVFPTRRLPGFPSTEAGTLHGEIGNQPPFSPLTLFAEKIMLPVGSKGDSAAYIDIDGVQRSFIFRMSASAPREDKHTALRVVAEPFALAIPDLAVTVETDHAPVGSNLELALGRVVDGAFETDAVRRFAGARQHVIGMRAHNGNLDLTAMTRDWKTTFDTTRVSGPRTLRARLLDDAGNEVVRAERTIVLDASAPAPIRFVEAPARSRPGRTVSLQVQGQDPESGIAQVLFFVGTAREGKVPADAATIAAVPIDAQRTAWAADVPLPEQGRGPVPVSVQFVNRVGLSSFATTTIELVEPEPDTSGLGRIRGKVMEGPRVQPGLEVILRDGRGGELARVKSRTDGSFQFDHLRPGRYVVFVFKPESQRRAVITVIVEPGKMAAAALNLSL